MGWGGNCSLKKWLSIHDAVFLVLHIASLQKQNFAFRWLCLQKFVEIENVRFVHLLNFKLINFCKVLLGNLFICTYNLFQDLFIRVHKHRHINYNILFTYHQYLNGFLTLTFSVTGFVLISCIAVDRLLLIVFALRFPPTRRRIYVMVAVSWLTGLSITTIRLLGTGRGFGYLPSTENCAGPYGDIIGTKRYLIVAGAVLMAMFIIVYGTITFYLWKGDQRLLRHTLARPKPVVKPKPPVDENGPNEIQMDSQVRFKVD